LPAVGPLECSLEWLATYLILYFTDFGAGSAALRSRAWRRRFGLHRVEVTFLGVSPARQAERALWVRESIEVEGLVLSCSVRFSFQPSATAPRSREVISLKSTQSGE